VSKELYEVLSLAARYLFSLLGMLIVLRSFFWLFSDHSERRRLRRRLPNAGLIGEMVVLSGGAGLREGESIPVPWEGVLGSVRSCDVFVSGDGVRRKHLLFLYEPGQGLLIRPFSGCEAIVNDTSVFSRTRPESCPMTHGSVLQVGQTVLRLRIFAGLDPRAGFQDSPVPSAVWNPGTVPVNLVQAQERREDLPFTPSFVPQGIPSPDSSIPARNPYAANPLISPGDQYAPVSSALPREQSGPEAYISSGGQSAPDPYVSLPEYAYPENAEISSRQDSFPPASPVLRQRRRSQEEQEAGVSPQQARFSPSESQPPSGTEISPPVTRRRRSDRWEVDWSE